MNGEWLLSHFMRLMMEHPNLLRAPVILSVSVPASGDAESSNDPTLDGLWDGILSSAELPAVGTVLVLAAEADAL